MPASFGSHCNGCPYNHSRHLSEVSRPTPLAMEDNESHILLIFQAPGVDEWASGRPISSTKPRSAGARLATVFNQFGKTRKNYNITNTVQCFPGKKPSNAGRRPRDNVPPASVRKSCSEWLREDIEKREYEKVVVFGALARNTVQLIGYKEDPRFHFLQHPTGGLSKRRLCQALGDEKNDPSFFTSMDNILLKT